MGLKAHVTAGDVLLLTPRNFVGRLIAKITFGKVNHAAIVFDANSVFETDGDQLKADFAPIEKYEGRSMYIIRAGYIRDNLSKVQRLCKFYSGSPYSYWDIVTNATFFFLTRQIRSKVVGLFGSKKYMVCSELISRILYEATGNKVWKDFEGTTPEDMRDIALKNPLEHTIKSYEGQQ